MLARWHEAGPQGMSLKDWLEQSRQEPGQV